MRKSGQSGSPKTRRRVAFFVSPHGFGHAARAAAIMAEMQGLDPSLGIEIFTTVPRWFFEKSLAGPFGYHEKLTDIGMAQRDALHEDIPATAERLARFLPFAPDRIREPAACLQAFGCQLAICDISPLGLAAAGEAGIPSVLVENFTWDWIYVAYAVGSNELQPYAEMLKKVFQSADYHIQARPACSPGSPNLSVPPVCRQPQTRPEYRAQAAGPRGGRTPGRGQHGRADGPGGHDGPDRHPRGIRRAGAPAGRLLRGPRR